MLFMLQGNSFKYNRENKAFFLFLVDATPFVMTKKLLLKASVQ